MESTSRHVADELPFLISSEELQILTAKVARKGALYFKRLPVPANATQACSRQNVNVTRGIHYAGGRGEGGGRG